MNRILLALITIVLMCAIVEILKDSKWNKSIVVFISIVYTCGLVYFTQINGNRMNITGVNIKFPLPFTKAIMNGNFGMVAQRSLLNLLLFVPFGYMLPNVFDSFEKRIEWWQVVVLGFVTSFIIESSQLFFHNGVYELDDLVKNTIGTGFGFLLFMSLKKQQL